MQQPNTQIDISKTTGVTCSECGGIFFDQTTLLRRISRFLTGEPQDTVSPVPVLVCRDCNSPLKEFFPAGMTDVEEKLGLTKQPPPIIQ